VRFLLFCNQGYGAAYEEAFRSWCRNRSVSDFAVVYSLLGVGPVSPAQRRLWRARVAVRNALRRVTGDRTIWVEDVNGAAFDRAWLRAGLPLQGVVAGFNQIFSPRVIARFARLYNFHPSLLPYYRGPVPSYWCIHNGEASTGLTLHEVDARIDHGRIVWQEEVPITTSDPLQMDRVLSRRGAALLPRVLDSLLTGHRFPEARVPAAQVYKTHVGYRSFPR
jgi:hypothetical protein